jgi:hypothetical protein
MRDCIEICIILITSDSNSSVHPSITNVWIKSNWWLFHLFIRHQILIVSSQSFLFICSIRMIQYYRRRRDSSSERAKKSGTSAERGKSQSHQWSKNIVKRPLSATLGKHCPKMVVAPNEQELNAKWSHQFLIPKPAKAFVANLAGRFIWLFPEYHDGNWACAAPATTIRRFPLGCFPMLFQRPKSTKLHRPLDEAQFANLHQHYSVLVNRLRDNMQIEISGVELCQPFGHSGGWAQETMAVYWQIWGRETTTRSPS